MVDYKSLESIIRGVSSGTDSRRKVVGVARPDPDATSGTESREKVELVGRPTGMSSLARQMAIQHNIIDEGERPDDDVQIAISKFKGNQGNKVDLRPMTDDRNNDNQRQDADSKKARRLANAMIGQPGSKTMTTEELVSETLAQDDSAKTPLQRSYQKMNSKTVGQSSGLTKMTQKAGKMGVSEAFEEELLEMLLEDPQKLAKDQQTNWKSMYSKYRKKNSSHVPKKKAGKKHMKTKSQEKKDRYAARNDFHKSVAKRVALKVKASGGSDHDAARAGASYYKKNVNGGVDSHADKFVASHAGEQAKIQKKAANPKKTKAADTVKAASAAARAKSVKEAE